MRMIEGSSLLRASMRTSVRGGLGSAKWCFDNADPDSYFTTLLRTTVAGIECTLQNLAIEKLAFSNRLTKEVWRKRFGIRSFTDIN